MKSIICLILVALTWGESVGIYWQLMKSGRYNEAAARIETFLTESRRVSEAEKEEADALVQKARICQEMSENAQIVVIVDSVKTTKDKMVKTCHSIINASSLIRGDKRLMAVNGDIYRQYGNDEKERLSDVINTAQNENYPYEMADGVTLYFSSEGHGAIGGYDLFRTRYDSETFDYNEPQNVGMPFSSLGNDYLMMADDITGIGLWTTDWRQKGDTVMIYVYRLHESEGEMKEKKRMKDVEEEEEEDEMMCFVVNDTMIYSKIEDFRSAEASSLYYEMREMEHELKLAEMLMENMRKAVREAESDEELEMLKNEIDENERYVTGLKRKVKEMVKAIRQLEIKQYE